MDKLTAYLLEVGLSSGILFLGFLLIRQHLQPKVRRFELLACLIAPILASIGNYTVHSSTWIPTSSKVSKLFNNRPEAIEPKVAAEPANPEINDKATLKANSEPINETTEEVLSSDSSNQVNFGLIIYLAVTLILICKLIISLLSLRSLIKSANWNDEHQVYFIDKPGFTGASFLNFILISKSLDGSAEYDSVLAHEQAHVRKRHSIDILLSEVISALFWYNPIFWIIKNQIKINNEYEVDQDITSSIGMKNYANLLVALSTRHLSHGMSVLNNFSYHNTKKRILQMQNPVQQRLRSLMYMIPFVLLAMWVASCDVEGTSSISAVPYTGQPIKSITTTFVSHQNDTEQKDMKTVAVANFLPDGSLDEVIQHMTYPYNYEQPVKVSFWGQTDANAVPVVLDGLSLSIAEYNFLYGNDWPAKYAEVVEKNHPTFKSVEDEGFSTTVTWKDQRLPSKIVSEENKTPKPYITSDNSFYEEFEYDGNQLSDYRKYVEMDRPIVEKVNGKLEVKGYKQEIYNDQLFNFEYTGNLLTKVSDKKVSYEFEYEGSRLVTSTYALNGKVYNTRKYYYTDSGLKERTEIFNVYGDAEYTIHYHYDFYES